MKNLEILYLVGVYECCLWFIHNIKMTTYVYAYFYFPDLLFYIDIRVSNGK